MPRQINYQPFFSSLIDHLPTQLEKTTRLLTEIRNGNYYHYSNIRNFLLDNLKTLSSTLSEDETKTFSSYLINAFPELIKERKERKIAYSTISKIIENTSANSLIIYKAYEKHILDLAITDRSARPIQYVFGLANARYKLLNDLAPIQSFLLARYIHPYKNYVNRKHLWDYTHQVKDCSKKAIFLYLIDNKPFYDDKRIIEALIRWFPEELEKLAILV